MVGYGPLSLMGICPGGGQVFLAGVLSPPLRGVGHPKGEALRGRPGDDAKCGFLGGARSPRPCDKAVR